MSLWRRFVNWLLRPDPIEIRVTHEPLEITVVVELLLPKVAGEGPNQAPPVEAPALEPETTVWEDEPLPELPQVRPMTVTPVEQPPALEAQIEAVVEAVAPRRVVRRVAVGPVKPAAIRAFGSKKL